MAWNDFDYTPTDGLNNVTQFPSKPGSGTDARNQFMTLFNQVKTFFNGTVKTEVNAANTNLSAHLADNTKHLSVMTTQGDLVYQGATSPARLAKGTAGQTLIMNAEATAPEWKTVDIPTPAMSLVTEITVGADTTAVDITGLNINTDKMYEIIMDIKASAAANNLLYLYFNTDYTDTNYYVQQLDATGTSVSANRYNSPGVGYIENSKQTFIKGTIIRDALGYGKYAGQENRGSGSAILFSPRNIATVNTITNITALRIKAAVSNMIAAGSKIRLYKIS